MLWSKHFSENSFNHFQSSRFICIEDLINYVLYALYALLHTKWKVYLLYNKENSIYNIFCIYHKLYIRTKVCNIQYLLFYTNRTALVPFVYITNVFSSSLLSYKMEFLLLTIHIRCGFIILFLLICKNILYKLHLVKLAL